MENIRIISKREVVSTKRFRKTSLDVDTDVHANCRNYVRVVADQMSYRIESIEFGYCCRFWIWMSSRVCGCTILEGIALAVDIVKLSLGSRKLGDLHGCAYIRHEIVFKHLCSYRYVQDKARCDSHIQTRLTDMNGKNSEHQLLVIIESLHG